jgi:hypothetical protein
LRFKRRETRDDQIKEDEMGGTSRTHGRDEKYNIWSEILKGRDHSEDLGTDGKIMLQSVVGK